MELGIRDLEKEKRRAVSDRPVVAMFVRNTFKHDTRVTKEATALIDRGADVVVFAVALDRAEVGWSEEGPIRVFRVRLPTLVSRFISLIASSIRGYARAVRVWKRLVHRIALTARRVPRDERRKIVFASPPPTVRAATAGKQRIRELLNPVHRFSQGLRFARLVAQRAAGLRPVAYHCHDLDSLPAGFRASRIHAAPVIYDAHELWPHRNRPDASRRKMWIVERADRYLSRRCDAVITVNDSIARHMQERYGLREVVVLRNVPALGARSEPPEWASLAEVPRPRLVYSGGLQRNRGLEQVIDAMPMINAFLFAVGPGSRSYSAALQERVGQRGVADRVRFLDPVPQDAVVPTVAQGDIGLCLVQAGSLSYYLSLPNKFFEYIHAGVPVLASDFPETRRLVDRYEIGAVCDPGDPTDIAAKVNDLLSRPDDLARMHENTSKAAQELNWELEKEQLVSLYRRVVPGALA